MNGWFAVMRSPEAAELQREHPTAFLLLHLIASRARWRRETCPLTGLNFAEARIGDFAAAGLKTEKSYRHAKGILQRAGYAAFRGANKGTVATLIDTSIFRIEGGDTGDPEGEQTDQPTGGSRGEQRGRPGATKKKERNKKEEGGTRANGSAVAAVLSPPPDLEGLLQSIIPCFPGELPCLSPDEIESVQAARECLGIFEAEDWEMTLAFFTVDAPTRKANGWKAWPRDRAEFLRKPIESIGKIREWWHHKGGKRWWTKRSTPPPEKTPPVSPSIAGDDFAEPDEAAVILAEFIRKPATAPAEALPAEVLESIAAAKSNHTALASPDDVDAGLERRKAPIPALSIP